MTNLYFTTSGRKRSKIKAIKQNIMTAWYAELN